MDATSMAFPEGLEASGHHRPHAMFFGEVEVDGLRQPRFAFVGAQLPGRMPGASV